MQAMFTTRSGREVFIRPLAEGDTAAALQFVNAIREEDTHVASFGSPFTYEEEEAWLKMRLRGMEEDNVVFLCAFFDSRLVGTASVDRRGGRSRHVGEFGIMLSKDFRGEGLGKKLAECVILEAKTKLALHAVRLSVYSENAPAISLYGQLNFLEVGRLPRAILYRGRYLDEIIMWLAL